jgi:hypothetical protein
MPRYGNARRVAVDPSASANWLYGFNTKADQDDSTLLGHVDIVAANPSAPVLFGVNNIKPPSAKKFKQATNTTESSFVDITKVAAAKAAGWTVTNGRSTAPKTSSKIKLVKVKVAAGVFIAWPMPKETYDRLVAVRTLNGIQDVAPTDSGLAYGMNSLLLPNGTAYSRKNLKATIQYGDAANPKTATTYVALDASENTGVPG